MMLWIGGQRLMMRWSPVLLSEKLEVMSEEAKYAAPSKYNDHVISRSPMFNLNLNDLLDYTDWEREKWHEFFRQQGDRVLKISAGEHAGERLQTIGDMVRHIFSAELRYIERLSGHPLTDTGTVPNDNAEAIFQLGQQSRRQFREFIETFPAQEWDVPEEVTIVSSSITVTPRKSVVHVVLHEIRHWAQIATLCRLNGFKGEFHDFLFSPVYGEIRKAAGS
jgi:uncharacterized damage-inducible protein DinB